MSAPLSSRGFLVATRMARYDMALPLIAEYAIVTVEIGAFAWAAWSDIAQRSIPLSACAVIALGGIVLRAAAGPRAFAATLAVACALFVILFVLYGVRAIGGGDLKLLVAAALAQTPVGTLRLLVATALAGGVLAMLHLAMRRLPRPLRAPAGSSFVRRVYAAERWRVLRRAPLPYGLAIACGGVWALLTHTGG